MNFPSSAFIETSTSPIQVLVSDMETLIRKLRLTQDYGHTTVGADYAKEMVAAGHALAMNAKNLLDTVDQARIAFANHADHAFSIAAEAPLQSGSEIATTLRIDED